MALLPGAGLGKLQAELRLADPGRADHGGQRARQQPPAEQFVESFQTRRKAFHHCTIPRYTCCMSTFFLDVTGPGLVSSRRMPTII